MSFSIGFVPLGIRGGRFGDGSEMLSNHFSCIRSSQYYHSSSSLDTAFLDRGSQSDLAINVRPAQASSVRPWDQSPGLATISPTSLFSVRDHHVNKIKAI